jgi:hypothetical protein
VPVGATGHRTQRPRGQVAPPAGHTHPIPALPWAWTRGAGGERWWWWPTGNWPIIQYFIFIFRAAAPQLAWLISQPLSGSAQYGQWRSRGGLG